MYRFKRFFNLKAWSILWISWT